MITFVLLLLLLSGYFRMCVAAVVVSSSSGCQAQCDPEWIILYVGTSPAQYSQWHVSQSLSYIRAGRGQGQGRRVRLE